MQPCSLMIYVHKSLKLRSAGADIEEMPEGSSSQGNVGTLWLFLEPSSVIQEVSSRGFQAPFVELREFHDPEILSYPPLALRKGVT